MEYHTKTPEETQRVSYEIADRIKNLRKDKSTSVVLGLSGDLGSGKTTFVQGLAEALGIQHRIVSPTFILMRSYQFEEGMFYHIDTYRLDENPENELENIGFGEIIENPNNVVVVEWAEKVKSILPSDTIYITFEYISDSERKIHYEEF